MTTGGAGRAGTARDGAGRTAAAVSVAAILAAGLLSGCATPASPASPASSSPGDYQSMGLSNGQYEILRSVVDEARVEHKRRGADAADELIRREARTGCAAWYRSGGPGAGAWR